MTAIIPLGKFERVPLKDAWPTEDGNFTPWLAQPETIVLLGDALNVELEVEAVEHWVGSFRADILARAIDSEPDYRVVIENQFGRTNHGHLGQILTYLAGIEGAKTVVWIAETIQADHRAAIDWLNTNTTEEFSFFAIEIELWRIGSSPPAPRFNVIASPNDWTRSARTAARQVGEVALTDRHRVRLAYWASFAEYLKERNSTFRIRRANKDHWFWFAIGRAGFGISASISTDKVRVGVELYASNDADKTAFHALHDQKETIEKEFGEPLEWQELPGRKVWLVEFYFIPRNAPAPQRPDNAGISASVPMRASAPTPRTGRLFSRRHHAAHQGELRHLNPRAIPEPRALANSPHPSYHIRDDLRCLVPSTSGGKFRCAAGSGLGVRPPHRQRYLASYTVPPAGQPKAPPAALFEPQAVIVFDRRSTQNANGRAAGFHRHFGRARRRAPAPW